MIRPRALARSSGKTISVRVRSRVATKRDLAHEALLLSVAHEFGHQYWQGMVATNEFEEAWLDEGINSYSEVKVLADIFGPNTSAIGRSWANFGDAGYQRISYLSMPD